MRPRRKRLLILALAVLATPLLSLFTPAAAEAHALAARQDLPIPAWLFAWGASVVLIVSFAALSFAWREPRFEKDSWKPSAQGLSTVLINPATKFIAGLFGAFLLVLTVYAGLHGTEAPDRNFAVPFVFVTFYLGIVVLSVIFGDIYPAFNPWRAIGKAFSRGFELVAGQKQPAPFTYPEKLGRWPAVAGLFLFVWLELVYGQGLTAVRLEPHSTAVAAVVYSAYTFLGYALFGIDKWNEKADAFTNFFHMFSLLSPFESRDGRIGRRTPLSGAARGWGDVPGSAALALVAIGVTSFDGAQEGALQTPINKTWEWFKDRGIDQLFALRLTSTIFMIIVVFGVAAVYYLGIQGMRTIDLDRPAKRLRELFAHSLIPIALAYLIAHYFSLIVFEEQAQFTYLLSDPLGTGADIFGTAGSGIDYSILSSHLIWYVQVASLVIGHVAGLTLAHDKAVSIYGDPRIASRSQYWMLAVMVAFTCFGLFLLSEANG